MVRLTVIAAVPDQGAEALLNLGEDLREDALMIIALRVM